MTFMPSLTKLIFVDSSYFLKTLFWDHAQKWKLIWAFFSDIYLSIYLWRPQRALRRVCASMSSTSWCSSHQDTRKRNPCDKEKNSYVAGRGASPTAPWTPFSQGKVRKRTCGEALKRLWRYQWISGSAFSQAQRRSGNQGNFFRARAVHLPLPDTVP